MRKLKKLRDILPRADVTALQEVHGESAEMETSLHEQAPQLLLFLNPGANRDQGGTVLLLKKSFIPKAEFCSHHIIVPGRVHAVDVWNEASSARGTFVNVHNYELSDADIAAIAAFVRPHLRTAVDDPMHRHVWMMGDFNFDAPGEEPRLLSDALTPLKEGQSGGQTVSAARAAHTWASGGPMVARWRPSVSCVLPSTALAGVAQPPAEVDTLPISHCLSLQNMSLWPVLQGDEVAGPPNLFHANQHPSSSCRLVPLVGHIQHRIEQRDQGLDVAFSQRRQEEYP